MNDINQEYRNITDSLWVKRIKITFKEKSFFHKAVGKLLWILSLGKNNSYMTDFVTTIGKSIALPTMWNSWSIDQRLSVLIHELVHIEQYKKFSWAFMLAYLFAFFPIGLAYFRYRFEREAYVAGYRKMLQINPNVTRDYLVELGTSAMIGPSYLWAWPFKKSVKEWFEKNL